MSACLTFYKMVNDCVILFWLQFQCRYQLFMGDTGTVTRQETASGLEQTTGNTTSRDSSSYLSQHALINAWNAIVNLTMRLSGSQLFTDKRN